MDFISFLDEWRNSEDYITVATSGSTGSPKEIKLSKKFLAESAHRTIKFFGIDSSSLLYSCVSPDFIGGKMMAVRAEIAGAKLLWEKPSNRPSLEIPPVEKISLLAVVPSQMDYILSKIEKLPEIKNIIIGGSPIPLSLAKRISESGLNAYETYGMTETASHIALRKIAAYPQPFRLLPDICIFPTDNDCLGIRFKGGGEILTNDVAEILSDNEFVIYGRADDVIITGGKKVNPMEIENLIDGYIPARFLISSLPDEKWGEKIVLVIEQLPTTYPPDEDNLKLKLRKILKGWQMPKEILYVGKLPSASNGKIKRLKNKELEDYIFQNKPGT